MLLSTDAPNNFQLRSFTGENWYDISLDDWTCSCADFKRTPGPCKHLKAFGIFSSPKPFIPKAHPSFSQSLSALIKSIRLRRPEDAVYWLMYLDTLRSEKRGKFRTARRLLVGSAEDGHSVAVMEKVVSNFSNLTREKTDLLYLASEAVRICKVQNWWNPATGGHAYIHDSLVGERELWQWNGGREVGSVTALLEDAIVNQKRSQALAAIAGYQRAALGSTTQAEIVLSLAKKYKHELAERLASVHLHARSALSGDNNFIGQAAWMLAGGISPVAEQIEPVFAGEVMELIEKAKERWKNPQPIPLVYCDGLHCNGNDPRLAGIIPNMYACCLAYNHYGRLNPEEDKWLPTFQCLDGLITRPLADEIALNCRRRIP